jgi:uncharacterized protein YegL
LLGRTKVQSPEATLDKNFINLQLQHTALTFQQNGVAFAGGTVIGSCTAHGNSVRFEDVLPSDGVFEHVGQHGKTGETAVEATSKSGKKKLNYSITIWPVADPDDMNPEPNVIVVDPEAPSMFDQFELPYTVFLGDQSVSMEGTRIEKLRNNLVKMINKYSTHPGGKRPFAVASWNHGIDWALGGKVWHDSDPSGKLQQWARQVPAAGSTAMIQALEQAAKCGGILAEKVKHIVVMCDGDIDPFTVDSAPGSNGTDWKEFYDSLVKETRNPNLKVHFVGFSNSANEDLRRMAMIGKGKYYHIPCK